MKHSQDDPKAFEAAMDSSTRGSKDEYSLQETVQRDRERAEEVAAEKNADIVEALPNQLLVDMDNGATIRLGVLDMIDEHYGIRSAESWVSSSGKGRHVVYTLGKDLSPLERVALQAALGSDGKREALAVLRIGQGIRTEPSLLFKPRGQTDANHGV